MTRPRKISISVTLAPDVAVIRRDGISRVCVAGILGREITADGIERVYLDRLLHRDREQQFDGWRVSGAISTILERPITVGNVHDSDGGP